MLTVLVILALLKMGYDETNFANFLWFFVKKYWKFRLFLYDKIFKHFKNKKRWHR